VGGRAVPRQVALGVKGGLAHLAHPLPARLPGARVLQL
jgi:hypothetical protein